MIVKKVAPSTQLRIAMGALAIALLAQRFVQPTSTFGPDGTDAIRGVLMGIAIGMNIVAIISMNRHRKA